ncbi:MAG: heavy metal translocating P-type ATPase [Pseudomonadota bacterium]|nr:heavy metal translocating P-type ATPase [Pseudomonadota bacterium]
MLSNINDVRINPVSRSVTVFYLGSQKEAEKSILSCIKAVVRPSTGETRPSRLQDAVIDSTGRSAVRSLGIATLALPLGMLPAAVAGPLFWACIAYSAWPSVRRAAHVVVRERRLNVDFQDSVSVALSLLGRQPVAAATMTWLIALGDVIRERTAIRSKRAIDGMLNFQDQLCWLLKAGQKVQIAVADLRVGDCVVTYAGDLVPVDGIVLRGEALVDQRNLTGESQAVPKTRNDEVFASSTVQEGQLYVRTVRCGAQTVVAQIVQAVEAAPLGETRAQNYAEKVADRIVAPNLALSAGLYAFSLNIDRFLSMVIVDYGTGIRVAAPTAILASMTDAARQGILIKSGAVVEKLARVDTVVFDKTGTITRGEPVVSEVVGYEEENFSRRRLIELAASAEVRLKHPAAVAVEILARKEKIKPLGRRAFKFHVGLGVEAVVGKARVDIGSAKYLQRLGIDLTPALADIQRCDESGSGRLLIAIDQTLVGLLVLVDEIRPEVRAVIRRLRQRGIRHITMLTGDNAKVASRVAQSVGLTEFVADVMPAEKAEVVRKLKLEGRIVAMVGDGVNDSVALAHADVGVAMRHGADIAREAADVVLMQDYMGKLVGAIDISRQAMRLIKQNVGIVSTLNTVALALAIPPGLMSPAVTALISNGSAILASLNSMRPVLKY